MFKNYEHAHPELAKQFKEAFANQLPEGWEQELPKYELGTSAASRVTSKETIQAISKVVPSFWAVQLIYLPQIIQWLLQKKISNLVNTKAVIFGLVFANLQWLQQ